MKNFLYTTKVASEITGINKWYEEIQEPFGKIKFHTSLMDKKKLQPNQISKWEKETLYLLENNMVKFLFNLSIGESYQTDSRSKNNKRKDW